MSLGELVVIFLVVLLVVKPQDIPVIIQKLHELRRIYNRFKDSIISYVNSEDISFSAEVAEINFYLKKIISINGSYHGDYTLEEIKKNYHTLIKSKTELVDQKQDH